MINILSNLMGKVVNMQEQMGNISKQMETLRKNQNKMLESKNNVTEMKSAFDGLISRLNMAKERISELEDMSIETSKTLKLGEKGMEKTGTDYPRTIGQLQKV